MATTHGQGTQAEVVLFQQLVRTAESVMAMHAAVGEQRRAEQLRVSLGVRLEAVRTRMPQLAPEQVTQPAIAPELTAAQRAMGGVAPARPGSPLPTPLTPRPQVPTTPPECGAER